MNSKDVKRHFFLEKIPNFGQTWLSKRCNGNTIASTLTKLFLPTPTLV